MRTNGVQSVPVVVLRKSFMQNAEYPIKSIRSNENEEINDENPNFFRSFFFLNIFTWYRNN